MDLLIADGVHIPFVALRNYLKVVGPERAIIVSDAISAAGKGPGVYQLAGQQVVVDERLATWAADRSHLVSSACTMRQMVENLRTKLLLLGRRCSSPDGRKSARGVAFITAASNSFQPRSGDAA